MKRQIKKGTVLQQEGTSPTHAFEVEHGLLRSFFVDELGKEHTFMFAPEGWVTADLEAAGFGAATKLTIEALEDSNVILLSLQEIQSIQGSTSKEQAREMSRLFRRAGALQRRVLMMMSTSALERYEFFLATYPKLQGRISQKLIASYLGVTPQALSKLRRQRVGR